jgi:hypothetical protein
MSYGGISVKFMLNFRSSLEMPDAGQLAITAVPTSYVLKKKKPFHKKFLYFVICLHFDSLVDILTNATSSSGMSL